MRLGWLIALLLATAGTAKASALPPDVERQLPPDYDVMRAARVTFAGAARARILVVLDRPGARPAAPRPLLLFARRPDGRFVLAGRNDTVVLRADEGGQCDPVEDGYEALAVHGRYFTVQNGVACGQHWTDFVTFRFDDGVGGYVFDNERFESWSMNPSRDPSAEALVRDGVRVRRGVRGSPVRFEDWRPSR